jgi:hypothetical protein
MVAASRRPLAWLGFAGLLAFAGWTRITQIPQVFIDGRVLPASADVPYHLHRILRASAEFPRVPTLDPLLNWPEGGPCPWPAGFDLMGATLVLLTGQQGDPAAAARIAAFLPVLLGLVLVAITARIATQLVPGRQRGWTLAFVAGAILAVLPQSIGMSRVARVDHHIAEAVAMALLGLWTLASARLDSGPPTSLAHRWRLEALVGGAALFGGFTFAGAVLYVALAVSLRAAQQLLAPGRPGSPQLVGSGAVGLAVAAAALAALSWPAVQAHGLWLDYRYASMLQPLLYLAAALGCAAVAWLATRFCEIEGARPRAARRAGVLAVLGAAGLCATVLLAPALAGEVGGGLHQWLARRDPWLASIEEFQPLFQAGLPWRSSDWAQVYEFWGVVGVLSPVLVPLGLWLAWRNDGAKGATFAAWTLAMLGLTLLQNRFGRAFCVNLALCAALALQWGAERIAARLESDGEADDAHAAADGFAPRVIGLVVTAAVALLVFGDPALRARLFWAEPRSPSAAESAWLFIAKRDAETGATELGGVIAPWDFGHDAIWMAGRGVLAAGFGPWTGEHAFAELDGYPRSDESALLALMERRRIDYVVSGPAAFSGRVTTAEALYPFAPGPDARGYPVPSYFQSLPLSALMLGGSGAPEIGVPHLEHMRPRFASPQAVGGLGLVLPMVWVYDRVEAAQLNGHAAPPGTLVTARLAIESHGRPFPYTAWTRADGTGEWTLRLPLPSGTNEGALRTSPAYRLEVEGEAPRWLPVSEDAVRLGAHLRADEAPLAMLDGTSAD